MTAFQVQHNAESVQVTFDKKYFSNDDLLKLLHFLHLELPAKKKHFAETPHNQVKPQKASEAALLKAINLDISEAEWTTYKHLIGLRRAEKLTEKEHEALIILGEKIEQANAQRLTNLALLAQIRGVSLQKLMLDFGIKPIEV